MGSQTSTISLDRCIELVSMSRATAAVAEADGTSNAIVIRHPTWIGATVTRADVASGREMEIQLTSVQAAIRGLRQSLALMSR